uniref:Methionine aminopeptidase n=1 Tax=Heliothis virescens TaxID=7102 RepID=A0A2A4J6L5_HELVI
MRVPKALNPRIQRRILKRFGVYSKVLPEDTTPSRTVPDYIEKPKYILSPEKLEIPKQPEIKNHDQIRGMQISCKLAANILQRLGQFIEPGVTTDDIDELAHNLSIDAGAYPSPLHYNGFPKSVCTSVNNVVVHGIPDLRPLENGDIVNVDITVFYKGFHGDCSKTFLVGDVDDRGLQLVSVTEDCLDLAIKSCGPGVPFSHIGHRIYKHAKKYGLTVIPSVLGHGIGEYFHGPPEVYHTINRYPGLMQPGMVFTIEPAITHGSEHTVLLEDGWTLLTEDGSRSAQAEHTVLITEYGAKILTK